MVDFAAMPYAVGYFRPARFDAEILDCETSGRIPADLNGAFYRMHADWFYPPKFRDDASLAADGYMSRFRFRAGVIDYLGCYVRTERFESFYGIIPRRVTFDLGSDGDGYREQILLDQEVTSFTRIDDRNATRPHRYIYVQYADRRKPFRGALPQDPRAQPVNSIARFELQSGVVLSWFAGEFNVVQEPCFVPRSAASAEGEGYLLATVHNLEAMRAELVILDALSMSELGRVLLPFRNASQVHGTWASEADLPLAT
jgi:carotenoid cleavage dioxygenase-like enzyme